MRLRMFEKLSGTSFSVVPDKLSNLNKVVSQAVSSSITLDFTFLRQSLADTSSGLLLKITKTTLGTH